MRGMFIQSLVAQARTDNRIFLITADMGYSVLEPFIREFPDRFLNAGIAEQNAAGIAAGLALSGKMVYLFSLIPFITMRCYEQIRVDIAYMNVNVRLVGAGAGYTYGPAGATHHAIEDIAIMRALPNMKVCCPGDPIELKGLLEASYQSQGPFYFRLGKGGEPNIHPPDQPIQLGKAIKVTDGNDLAIITTSNMLEQCKIWVDQLLQKGKKASLISMHTLKPLDTQIIMDTIRLGIPIVTVEEHNIIGGLGSAVAEVIAESGKGIKFKRIGIKDVFTHKVGSQKFLREWMGLCPLDCDELF